MADDGLLAHWREPDATILKAWQARVMADPPASRAESAQEGRADRDLTAALAAELRAWKRLLLGAR